MKPLNRTIGFYLAFLIVIAQLTNGVRGLIDPMAFASYFGLPSNDGAWVQVYALRALFLGAFAAALLWRREISALRWMSLIALLLPLGDLYLVWNAGATTPILVRHALIALVLLTTFVSLHRWLARAV